MEPTDLTIEILRSIRDEVSSVREEVKSVREEVKSVRDELHGFREEASERFDRLERRQTEADIRVATELVAVSGVLREMRDTWREEVSLRAQVDDHERRLQLVEKRAP